MPGVRAGKREVTGSSRSPFPGILIEEPAPSAARSPARPGVKLGCRGKYRSPAEPAGEASGRVSPAVRHRAGRALAPPRHRVAIRGDKCRAVRPGCKRRRRVESSRVPLGPGPASPEGRPAEPYCTRTRIPAGRPPCTSCPIPILKRGALYHLPRSSPRAVHAYLIRAPAEGVRSVAAGLQPAEETSAGSRPAATDRTVSPGPCRRAARSWELARLGVAEHL